MTERYRRILCLKGENRLGKFCADIDRYLSRHKQGFVIYRFNDEKPDDFFYQLLESYNWLFYWKADKVKYKMSPTCVSADLTFHVNLGSMAGVDYTKRKLLILSWIFRISGITKITPGSIVLPEKLTGLQIVKKFPKFYETQRFITAFTRARHLSLSWAKSIQSM